MNLILLPFIQIAMFAAFIQIP